LGVAVLYVVVDGTVADVVAVLGIAVPRCAGGVPQCCIIAAVLCGVPLSGAQFSNVLMWREGEKTKFHQIALPRGAAVVLLPTAVSGPTYPDRT
jgi:adenosylcobinamide amidohydrolase